MKILNHQRDDQVKCRTDDEDFEPDRSKLVGVFLPVLKNRGLLPEVIDSLYASMPDGDPFGITVVDGGSKDGTVNWCAEQKIACFGNHMPKPEWPYKTNGLCKDTPNAAIYALLGAYDPTKNRFEKEDRYGFICWIHSDMRFPQEGWLGTLVDHYIQNPSYGILGPKTQQYPNLEGDREGNVAPFIISVAKLKKHYKKHGWFYPPQMWFCVGYCDWAMHFRFKDLGFKSMVTSKAYVNHRMCGTRIDLQQAAPKERQEAWDFNKSYYRDHHHTEDDPWNSQFGKK